MLPLKIETMRTIPDVGGGLAYGSRRKKETRAHVTFSLRSDYTCVKLTYVSERGVERNRRNEQLLVELSSLLQSLLIFVQ